MNTFIKNLNTNEITRINGECACFCRYKPSILNEWQTDDGKYGEYVGDFPSIQICKRICSIFKGDVFMCVAPGDNISGIFPMPRIY